MNVQDYKKIKRVDFDSRVIEIPVPDLENTIEDNLSTISESDHETKIELQLSSDSDTDSENKQEPAPIGQVSEHRSDSSENESEPEFASETESETASEPESETESEPEFESDSESDHDSVYKGQNPAIIEVISLDDRPLEEINEIEPITTEPILTEKSNETETRFNFWLTCRKIYDYIIEFFLNIRKN